MNAASDIIALADLATSRVLRRYRQLGRYADEVLSEAYVAACEVALVEHEDPTLVAERLLICGLREQRYLPWPGKREVVSFGLPDAVVERVEAREDDAVDAADEAASSLDNMVRTGRGQRPAAQRLREALAVIAARRAWED